MAIGRVIELLEELKKREENGEYIFNMNNEATQEDCLSGECNTLCCIGGHCAILLGKDEISVEDALREFAGIPLHDARKICWPGLEHTPYANITIDDAITVLKHYENTGIVDWSLSSHLREEWRFT